MKEKNSKQSKVMKLDVFSWKIFNSLCKQNFLLSGEAYLIAISGGCDSVALSRLFHSFLKKMDFKLELVHFHLAYMSRAIFLLSNRITWKAENKLSQ